MTARRSWVWIFCLAGGLALAGEPEDPGAARHSQVPRRRVRRTYDQQVQFHQPGTETAVAPPEKEKFVPGDVPSGEAAPDLLLTRPESSFTPPLTRVNNPATGENPEEKEDSEDEENDLWVLKTPDEVLGVSTNQTASSILGGWIAQDMETRNHSKEVAEEEDAQEAESEEDAGTLSLLTVQERGPASLLARMENLSSNTAERIRSPADAERPDSSSAQAPNADRFAPRSESPLDRAGLIPEVARSRDSETAPAASAPDLPKPPPDLKPEDPAPVRSTPSGAGAIATKWEPPAFSPTRAPDSSAASYGRVGAIFGPEPPARAPASLNLPSPAPGFGSGPAPLPDNRFKSFGTPGPLLPPLRSDRSAVPSRTQVQPFLPGRYEP